VSRALLALNLLFFVGEVVAAGGTTAAIGSVPVRTLLLFGADDPSSVLHDGRVELLVTACFLHGGLLHVGFNMLVLWQVAPLVERAVGSARMAPMYLLAGIVASLASAARGVLRHDDMPSVGASGAIMGVIAAALVLAWRAQGWKSPLTRSLSRWLLINLAFGFVINASPSLGGGGTVVDNAAHLGGAVGGALIALAWRRGIVYSRRATIAVVVGCAVVVAAAFATVVWHDTRDPFAAFRT
jgi:rhomboid protease GluP